MIFTCTSTSLIFLPFDSILSVSSSLLISEKKKKKDPLSSFVWKNRGFLFSFFLDVPKEGNPRRKDPLNQRRESGRLAPDLPVLGRAQIQQAAAVLIVGRLFANQSVDAEVPLLLGRRMSARYRGGPRRRGIDLPDRGRGDRHGFVQRWRRLQEPAQLQCLQGRGREVEQGEAGRRGQVRGAWIGERPGMTATTARTRPPVPPADGERGHDRPVPQHVVRRGPLVPLPPAKEAPVVEHVLGQRVQRPVIALARVTRFPRYLDEAVIQRQVVSDRVLPCGELVVIIGESGHDELAYPAQRQLLLGRLEDSHGDEGYVGVRGFDQGRGHLVVPVRGRSLAGPVPLLLPVPATRHHRVALLAAAPSAVTGGRGGRRDGRAWYYGAGRRLGRRQVVLVQTHRVHDHAAAVGISVAVRAPVARQVRHHHPTRFHRDRASRAHLDARSSRFLQIPPHSDVSIHEYRCVRLSFECRRDGRC